MEDAFIAALEGAARERFADRAALGATLDKLAAAARGAYPEIRVEPVAFAGEAARRLGPTATLEQLAGLRADHLYLAIACASGDPRAVARFEADLLDEVAIVGARLRADPDQIDDVRGHVRRVLFVSEPGRPAALSAYSGRGDLRSYLRVIATRELVRVVNRARRDVSIDAQAMLELIAPDNVNHEFLKAQYQPAVTAALRAALAGLAEEPRALLRYSIIEGWSVDRIGVLYGVHRATAARRVAAARDQLAVLLRAELAASLAISLDEVDSIVRLVQSRIEVSLERLL